MNRRLRRALMAPAALLLLGMNGQLPFCPQQTIDPALGNVHRLSDVVVLRPRANDPSNDVTACTALDPNCALGTQGTLGGTCREDDLCDTGLICNTATNTCDAIPRTYVVVANPEIEQLRIYDAYDRDFLRGPNVYFPLSVHTGPATRRLAVAAGDPDIVYALDGADDAVRLVRTYATATAAPFTTVGAFRTGRAPGDIAAVSTSDTTALVFVTLPDDAAVEVYDVDEDTGLARQVDVIDLGDGSVPAMVAADPTGDAVVVTDAALDSVAIITTDPVALDRRIDVGGPTDAVATGVVDPGDGLGPVALVSRRDAAEVSALQLYRPDVRGEKYTLLATAELPEPAVQLYVPDQLREGDTEPTVCCPDVLVDQEATLAWAMTLSADGVIRYLRFDGERGDATDRRRGLLRLIDNDEAPPGPADDVNLDVASDVWFPTDINVGGRPSVTLSSIDNFGEPPTSPYWPVGYSITLTWEGTPAGGRNRLGSVEGGLLSFQVDSSGQTVGSRDIGPGDLVRVDTRQRESSQCPAEGFYLFTIASVQGSLVDVGGLDGGQLACLLTGGPFTAQFFVAEAWTVDSSRDGYLGRLVMDDGTSPPPPEMRVEVPSIAIGVTAAEAGLPARGSQLVLPLAQHVDPLSIELSQPLDAVTLDGFGQLGLLPTGIAGFDAFIQPVGDRPREVRRLFISIGGSSGNQNGRLLELNETETSLARGQQRQPLSRWWHPSLCA
jgi:hypothetical protein